MGEEYKELLNDNKIISLCSNINKLARERDSLMIQKAPKFLVSEAEEEISYKQEKLRSLISDKLRTKMPVEPIIKEAAECVTEAKIEISPISVSSLMGSNEKEIYYYTIIAKDHARKEMPDLTDAYPNHFYYAIICIETDDGQYVKIIQDEQGEMPYYPELDQAETQARRIQIMHEFLTRLPDRYIHAKYEDLFGD